MKDNLQQEYFEAKARTEARAAMGGKYTPQEIADMLYEKLERMLFDNMDGYDVGYILDRQCNDYIKFGYATLDDVREAIDIIAGVYPEEDHHELFPELSPHSP